MSLEGRGALTACSWLIWQRPWTMPHTRVSAGGLIKCPPANSLSARISHSLLCFLPLLLGHFVDSTLPMGALSICPRRGHRPQHTERNRSNKASEPRIRQHWNTPKPDYLASSWNIFLNFFTSTQFFNDNKNGTTVESCHFSIKTSFKWNSLSLARNLS